MCWFLTKDLCLALQRPSPSAVPLPLAVGLGQVCWLSLPQKSYLHLLAPLGLAGPQQGYRCGCTGFRMAWFVGYRCRSIDKGGSSCGGFELWDTFLWGGKTGFVPILHEFSFVFNKAMAVFISTNLLPVSFFCTFTLTKGFGPANVHLSTHAQFIRPHMAPMNYISQTKNVKSE